MPARAGGSQDGIAGRVPISGAPSPAPLARDSLHPLSHRLTEGPDDTPEGPERRFSRRALFRRGPENVRSGPEAGSLAERGFRTLRDDVSGVAERVRARREARPQASPSSLATPVGSSRCGRTPTPTPTPTATPYWASTLRSASGARETRWCPITTSVAPISAAAKNASRTAAPRARVTSSSSALSGTITRG